MSEKYKLDFGNFLGALLSFLVAGFVAVAIYIVRIGSVFLFQWDVALDIFVITSVSAFLTSLGKSYVTDSDGTIAGVKVK